MSKKIMKLVLSSLNVDKKTAKILMNATEKFLKEPSVHKAIKKSKKKICGKYYNNNKTRSLMDVMTGEYISKKKRNELS